VNKNAVPPLKNMPFIIGLTSKYIMTFVWKFASFYLKINIAKAKIRVNKRGTAI
jgi:hypothetical protein